MADSSTEFGPQHNLEIRPSAVADCGIPQGHRAIHRNRANTRKPVPALYLSLIPPHS